MSLQIRRDVFQAIADPTRREIINMVARDSLNLNSIASKFDMSRSAISQHIKILVECDLIKIKQEGRERYCEAKLESLNEVHEWTEQYRAFWTQKFDALRVFLEKETQPSKSKKQKIKSVTKQTKRSR